MKSSALKTKNGPGRPPNEAGPTRERLIEAAADLFNREGYFGTDSNKIARAAGFAPATFYKHFTDKKAAFLEAYARWVRGDWAIIEAAVKGGGEARVIAQKLVRAYLARHRRWTKLRQSMHALVATDRDVRAFHLKTRNAQLDRMTDLLTEHGASKMTRAELLYSFLCIERAANAVTDGDLEALGVPKGAFVAHIEEEIFLQLMGRR